MKQAIDIDVKNESLDALKVKREVNSALYLNKSVFTTTWKLQLGRGKVDLHVNLLTFYLLSHFMTNHVTVKNIDIVGDSVSSGWREFDLDHEFSLNEPFKVKWMNNSWQSQVFCRRGL